MHRNRLHHPREGDLLFEINAIPVCTGIYKPATNGIMHTRLRGYDGGRVLFTSKPETVYTDP